ncbi:MAG: helix-turn-helix transcriptional regulator [Pseudomonadota bacterium]
MELLVYFFVCFSVGLACLGVVVLWFRLDRSPLAGAFLVFYAALSIMVMAALFRSLLEVLPQPTADWPRLITEYLESMVGRYGLMLSMPILVHRLFGVAAPRRETALIAAVLLVAALQHLTEYGLGGAWDERGDVFEDVFSAGLFAYVTFVGVSRWRLVGPHRVLAHRTFAVFLVAIPGIAFDLFWVDDGLLRFYPVLYCVFSLMAAWTLIQHRVQPHGAQIPESWGLSEREAEVASLVLRGRSNREIAEQLNISLNTVKTHLRSVFEKSGVSSRFELMSATQPRGLIG